MPATLACPTCDASGVSSPLNPNGGSGYRCGVGHTFSDTEELIAMKPRTIQGPTVKKERQGMKEFKTMLPENLITALSAQFGNVLPTVFEGMGIALLDPGAFVVSGFDADRLGTHLGVKVKDGGSLVGLVFNMRTERDAARKEAEVARSAKPATGGGETNALDGDFVKIGLCIPLEDFLKIKSKASGNTVEYMQSVISNALEQGWF